MKIKVTSVYVDDQDKALRFYTEILGFAKKTDFSQGPYRWLTVASPEEPDGTELQLALNNNPAAKTYQQAMFQQRQPAAMFFTDDVKSDYEQIKARGAEFTMPPTDVTGSTIAMLNDTCGNLIQLTQLARWSGNGEEDDRTRAIHRVPPRGAGSQGRRAKSGRSFSSGNCATRRKKSGGVDRSGAVAGVGSLLTDGSLGALETR